MIKNIFLSIITGFLLAIGWPTYGMPLFLFIGFVPLLLVEYRIRKSNTPKTNGKVFLSAFIAFSIFNFSTTYWIIYATPFGMFFANIANALLMSFVFLSYHIIAKKITQKLSLVFLICLWIGFEKFHLNWEFSWPWLNLGNGFADYHKWIQWYEYTGVFGGTFWIWLVNIIVYKAFIKLYSSDKTQFIKRILMAFSLVVIGIFSSIYIYYTLDESHEKTSVIVVQPNIDSYSEKYTLSNKIMVDKLIRLTEKKIDSTTSFIITPETYLSTPRLLNTFRSSPEYKLLNNFRNKYNSLAIVSGITFIKRYSENVKPNKTANFYRDREQWYNSFNAAFFLYKKDTFDFYHKSKLVVGVEHIPYRSLLNPILKNNMIDLGGSTSTLTPQKERSIFKNGKNSLAPIICYESVYGEFVTEYVKKGADFLAIITNDGWWNTSQGHKQHLSIAKLRAIETRRSIARAANTGVSALINQKGDILQALPYGQMGTLKGKISTSTKQSYYTIHGDYIYRISMFVLIIILVSSFTKRRQKPV